MTGYTKLFSSILASTVWRSNDKTRIVWITLLAMADRQGIAEGSIPGLADMARVSITDCEAALAELAAPDAYSRTKDADGRRIESIDGGWRLINHAKYRAKMSADERRDYKAAKQAEYRQRDKHVDSKWAPVDKSGQCGHIAEAEAEASPKAEATQEKVKPLAVRASRSLSEPIEFVTFWALYPKRVGRQGALRAWIKHTPNIDKVKAALSWQTHQPGWVKDRGQFIPHPATWINAHQWEDEPFHVAESDPNAQLNRLLRGEGVILP